MVVQIISLFMWNSISSFRVKNHEVWHIKIVSTPSFKRSDSINMLLRHPIMDVGWTVYRFIPKLWWKCLRLHHASGHLLERSILSLINTILMRCVGNRVLHTIPAYSQYWINYDLTYSPHYHIWGPLYLFHNGSQLDL